MFYLLHAPIVRNVVNAVVSTSTISTCFYSNRWVCYVASFPGPRPAFHRLQYSTAGDGKLGKGLGLRLHIMRTRTHMQKLLTPQEVVK